MFFFIILLLIAIIPAAIAKSKGRSFVAWYFYGVLLWIVAIIHSIVLKEDSSQNTRETVTGKSEKRCPYCSEFVNINAIVCKYCGRVLSEQKSSISNSNNHASEIDVKSIIGKEMDFNPEEKEIWISQRILALISDGKSAGDAKIQADAEFLVKKVEYERKIAEKIKEQTEIVTEKEKKPFENIKEGYEIIQYKNKGLLKPIGSTVDNYFCPFCNEQINPNATSCYLCKKEFPLWNEIQ